MADEYIIELTGEEADKILKSAQADIEAVAYQQSIIEPTVRDVIRFIMLIREYYAGSFPILSKTSSLVSTDVDTIEWNTFFNESIYWLSRSNLPWLV